MSENPTKFLIPHDGSALSNKASETLVPLMQTGTQVTLLHVRDGEPLDESAIGEAKRVLTSNGANVTVREVASNDIAGGILDVAAELRPNLVVMSTHGRSGIERFTRGSVAERVLRRCPVPLLMTNPFTQGVARTIDSILVPLDESDASAEVLESVIPVARTLSAKVTLLFVDFEVSTDTAKGAAVRRAQREEDIHGWLASPRERAEKADIPVSIEIVQGHVAEEILRHAEPGRHGLLAMTTHGRSGAGRWLLGSTAEQVLRHARIPVLLHRVGSVPLG